MKEFRFNKEKDEILKSQRGVGFSEIIQAIREGNVVKVIDNPNVKKYPSQKV